MPETCRYDIEAYYSDLDYRIRTDMLIPIVQCSVKNKCSMEEMLLLLINKITELKNNLSVKTHRKNPRLHLSRIFHY